MTVSAAAAWDLDADLVAGLSETFFARRFDGALPTPRFHRAMWEACCRREAHVVIAAPRSHGKSTAGTHVYGLTELLTGHRDHALVISATETQAIQFVNDMKVELSDNAALRTAFGVVGFDREGEGEWIVRCKPVTDLDRPLADDGFYRFRVVPKGSEQKLRGLKWRSKRPNLVLVDDLEEDEQVESVERRRKLRSWFNRALLQVGSDYCLYRVFGTVMHSDALLVRLLKSKLWTALCFEAHDDAYSRESVLWPEKFPLERLLAIRSKFIEDGDPSGYAREYRNRAIDEASAMFRRASFKPLSRTTGERLHYVGVDLAVSQNTQSDYSVFGVGAVPSDGKLQVVDVRRRRMDTLEIIETFFEVWDAYRPELFLVERGTIQHSILPFLNEEMRKRGKFLPLEFYTPVKDKRARARSFHAKMSAGAVEWDMDAPWFLDCQDELCEFDRGRHDDQVDALSLLGLALDAMTGGRDEAAVEEDEWEDAVGSYAPVGINEVTGY